MLKKLKEQGITILVSTPYMDEASLVRPGSADAESERSVTINTPEGVIDDFDKPLLAVKADDMLQLVERSESV